MAYDDFFDRPRPGDPGYFAAPATRAGARPPRQGEHNPYLDMGPSGRANPYPNLGAEDILSQALNRWPRPQGPPTAYQQQTFGMGDQSNPFEGNPIMEHINPSRYQQSVLNRAFERFGLEPRGTSPYIDSPMDDEFMDYEDDMIGEQSSIKSEKKS